MRLKKVEITNYKGIEHLELSFDEGINLLIGNNGAGKTSLLDALSIIINQPLGLLRVNSHLSIGDNVRATTSMIGDVTGETVYHYPVKLLGDIWFKSEAMKVNLTKMSEVSSEEQKNHELLRKYKELFQNNYIDTPIPLLCYQRAGRGVVLKKNNSSVLEINNKQPERIEGYNGAFSETFDISLIQKWCLQMEFSEFQKKKQIKEYKTFQTILSTFMSKLDENATKPEVFYSSDNASLVYSDGKKIQPIYNLSAGYQSVLCLIMELAYRSVMLNPSLENVSQLIDGIVLIDEIEIHLHPRWQWKVLSALKETFPRVQWIVASHSPIILSSIKDASLFFMRSPDEVVSLESAYGYSVNDVLDYRLGSNDSPVEIKEYFDQLEKYFDTDDLAGVDELLAKAKEEFGDDSDLYKRIKEFASVFYLAEDI